MENEQHIKTLQTDSRGKNRLKYVSTKERAKLASADVYRSYHRRGIGVTSAASREERLHNPVLEESQRSQKRQRIIKNDDGGRVAVVSKAMKEEVLSDDDDSAAACESSNFASELDIANDRNASEIFGHFYQHVWPLVRSLPELLHHAPQVIEALVSYMLSPSSSPGEISLMDEEEGEKKERYIVNRATTDVLHMMGALARDLRHEIHPFLHKFILPRIIHDLLNPPIDPSVQQQPLNVTLVEAAFRTLSYIFRYDVEQIISQVDKPGQEPCLEQMRQYYGVTLAHRREVVRRMAAESFAPLIRKIKTDTARCRHLRRILRALAVSSVSEASGSNDVRMKRTQEDAVDGISQLFFQVARGISGRLHSKGRLVVKSLLDACVKDFPEKEIIVEVASSFFHRLSQHLDTEEFSLVVNDLLITTQKQLPSKTAIQMSAALPNCLRLIVDVVSFRDGEQLRDVVSVNSDESVAKAIVQILEVLCHELTFPFLAPPTRKSTLMLLCATWKALKGSPTLQSTLESMLPGLLKQNALIEMDGAPGPQQLSQDATIRILLEELLPYLPRQVAMGSLGSATLVAAASLAKVDPWDAMSMVHILATTHIATEEEDDVDTLLYVDNASSCSVPFIVKETLLDTALSDVESKDVTTEIVRRIGIFARCAVFVIAVSTESGDQRFQAQYKQVTKWLFRMVVLLDGLEGSSLPCLDDTTRIVVKAFLVEALALMTKEMSSRLRNQDIVKKTLSQAKVISQTMLLSNPSSIWTVKSAAAVVDACQETHIAFSENRDELFEKLVPNLRKESHFLRLHTLRILASFGTRSFVTDHAELDLSDDLDEEKSTFPNQGNDRQSVSIVGVCDVIDTLLSLEASPVNLVNERHILSLISRVEVLARCGRLPVAFTEAAANHMLGIFHIKFAAIWPVATGALVAIAENNTDLMWPSLHAIMTAIMKPPPKNHDAATQIENVFVLNPTYFVDKCCTWEVSQGCDSTLFQKDVLAAQNEGRVSRHQHIDPSTRFELVWRVLEEAECILLKKSRAIVPIFLDFLKNQYFVFFEDDPNAREINLDLPEIEQTPRWKRDELSKSMIQARLLSMLKAFGVVKGPRQLYKSEILKAIFTAFLSHSDFNIAQLALNCLIKYKLSHITPHVDHMRAMFKRFELRETLLKFETSAGIEKENRKSLMPILSRILFGRLSARALGNNSSRDSPAARRTAVLSFLSRQCEEDGDMYPFIYLMVRSFLPRSCSLKPVEDHDNDDRLQVDRLLQSLHGSDLKDLTPQVLEGFLHLLEAVVSQLGQRLRAFVPQLMSVVMAIFNLVQQQLNSESDMSASAQHQQEITCQYEANSRSGAIRTLCFRRLSDIYSQFSSTVDLSSFTTSLWNFSRGSVEMLPQVVVNSDKVPSLLCLLRTLSSHPKLLPILTCNDDAVKAVFLCVCETSSDAVMDAALTIIENLLADGKDSVDSKANDRGHAEQGWGTIRKHVPLLLSQFTSRLRGSNESTTSPMSLGRRKAVVSMTWRRELGILCRISEVALQGHVSPGEGDQESLETLCALLIPFLGKRGAVSEGDQMNVLGILRSCWSKVGKDTAHSHYEALSRLLGPCNGHPGVSSLQVRSAIAGAVQALADRLDSALARKVSESLVKLCSINAKRVDEVDYESVIPAINGLFDASSDSSWLSFLRGNDLNKDFAATTEVETLMMLSPLVYCCCHQMFDTDGVVSRGSYKAIKTLVGVLCRTDDPETERNIENLAVWANDQCSRKFLEGTIIPLIRQGLNARNVTVRKYFILILSDVARGCRLSDSPNLYGDLNVLSNADDQDLDFFLNITHVQIHRRTRAFQRLRKLLNQDFEDNAKAVFTLQSLSNVLLPLAMHPIYECRTKAEETFALEAIETAGAIARHLSWSKYHSALWTPLAMFDRHPEQERYLIGVICAIIDGFHFDVDSSQEEGDEAIDGAKNSVLRALEKRVIPKIEALMTKEKSNRDGTKTKTLRATVVLALFKLFKKFPKHYFEARLARLLAVICSALRDKESDARDVARNTLAKMASDIDLSYLGDIIRELAVSLTEGYQLHVRSATLHTVLLGLSKSYRPETPAGEIALVNNLDYCVPAIMDLVQQDLFGEARERREVEGAKVRYVKEASGSKGLDSIEVICSLICFQPSVEICSLGKTLSTSSVHAVVAPLLERLRSPEVDASSIRRVGQCLQRVVSGLARNPTVTREELLPFIYATIEPFIDDQAANTVKLEYEGADDENFKPLAVTRNDKLFTKVMSPDALDSGGRRVVEWRPSALQSSKDSADALQRKKKEAKDLRLVQDGANAPKLTGSSRHRNRGGAHQVQTLNLPANIQAVLFGLNLLQAGLKRFKRIEDSNAVGMLDPFVSLLTTCTCYCRDTDIVLVSLRCLILMFPMKLPSVASCARLLGTKTLDILSSSGGASQVQSETAQASFKLMTLLMKIDDNPDNTSGNNATVASEIVTITVEGENALASGIVPLDSEQMIVLLSLIEAAISESGQHNQALGLINALVSRRFISPEFYDLLEKVLELSVRSHTASIRLQASNVFTQYLLNYPMEKHRVEQHLKQVLLNTKYEYEAGRLSAIGLATSLVEKLPATVLGEYAQLFFLPLVLQLVNDDSQDCREAIAKCLSRLLKRVPLDVLRSIYEYVVKWSEGTESLQRTALQLFGLFVEAREDFMTRPEVAQPLLDRLGGVLVANDAASSWELVYFSLTCLEKFATPSSTLSPRQTDLLVSVVFHLKHSHPWIKQASTRIVSSLLPATSDDALSLPEFVVARPGTLFDVARNLCIQIDADDQEQSEETSTDLTVKTLVKVLHAMHNENDLSLPSTSCEVETKDPIKWVITRLSQTAKPKRPKVRSVVFKFFAAFSTCCSPLVTSFLELMLEPLHRSIAEASNELDNPDIVSNKNNHTLEDTPLSRESALARDVLQLLEEQVDTEAFLNAFAAVKTRAKEKKEQRKILVKSEAARNPEFAAKRKVIKHDREKRRRKRKNEEQRRQRGGLKRSRTT